MLLVLAIGSVAGAAGWQSAMPHDPATYTQPRADGLLMTRTAHRIDEYACHEGHYSMAGTLRGARAADAKPGVR